MLEHANLPGLQDTYDTGYAHFRENSRFTPAEQEVVFLTSSIENSCDYCTAAHSYLVDKVSKTLIEVTNAIGEGKGTTDAKLRAFSGLTKVMHETRRNPSPQQAQVFLDAGKTEKNILAIISSLSAAKIASKVSMKGVMLLGLWSLLVAMFLLGASSL